MIIYIDTYGVDISKDNNCFKITDEANTKILSPLKITAFQIYKPCTISSPAMVLAVENNIPIIIHDATATPVVRISNVLTGNHGLIKKHQVLCSYQPEGLQWINENITLKNEGQLDNAKYCYNRKGNDAIIQKWISKIDTILQEQNAKAITNLEQVTIAEAQVSRCYWHIVQLTLAKKTIFTHREKQMATMPFNAALHYAYGMLYNVVETAIHTAGLDAQISILHTDKYATRSFVFDAIEPFRPWVDKLIIDLFLTEQLTALHFEPYETKGISLSKPGKAIIIPAVVAHLNEKNVFMGKKIKRKDQIQYYLTSFAQYLLKEFKPSHV